MPISPAMLLRMSRGLVLLILLLFVLPTAASFAWWATVDRPVRWSEADWGPSGVLPPATDVPGDAIHVMTARTGGWKGAVAVHSWIVWKRAGDVRWTRHDVVGWGAPVRRNAYPPDGRWYSNEPWIVGTVAGPRAAAAIPKLALAVEDYPWSAHGDYRIWPGPNSNTFVEYLLRSVPELGLTLPPNAAGKDWTGRLFLRDAGGDVHVGAWGLAGLSAGPRTGLELHFMGQTFGVDLRRPALKLPSLGRVEVATLRGVQMETS